MGIPALNRLSVFVVLLWAGCAASSPPSESVSAPTTAASEQEEHLLAEAPGGWIQIGGTVTKTLKLAEFVPDRPQESAVGDESSKGWTEKITFERLLGTPVADPLEFLRDLKAETSAACPAGAFHPITSGLENGYPTAVALIVCPRQSVPDVGQLTMIKAIQGNEAFYTITRAIRTPAFSASEDGKPVEPAVERETIGGFSVYLKAITVCDPTRSAHPCPEISAESTTTTNRKD